MTYELVPEFVGQIIEIFEAFLEDRHIVIDNIEKQWAITDDHMDPDEVANIYGCDYGELQSEIETLLSRWNIIKEEK